MTKPKDRSRPREKISVASEIDRIEERKVQCNNVLERAEYRRRKEELSDEDSKLLEEEMNQMAERIQKYDDELETLRRENRRNMVLSVALLAISALFYYSFVY